MSELKNAKDSLVASLFELSKAAQDAAAATVNFYKSVGDEGSNDPSEALQSLSETLKGISGIDAQAIHDAVSVVENNNNLNEQAVAAGAVAAAEAKPKRKKAERDPNAPKKPLTIYFAFSFHTREEIRDQRKRDGLPALSAIDMNELVKDKWQNISKEEKEYWQKKYANELKAYQKEKEKYKQSLENSQTTQQAQQALAQVQAPEQDGFALPAQLGDIKENLVSSQISLDETPEAKAEKKKEKKRKSEKEKSEKKDKKSKKQ